MRKSHVTTKRYGRRVIYTVNSCGPAVDVSKRLPAGPPQCDPASTHQRQNCGRR